MTQPFYLPALPAISPKPNVIRGGLPCSAGSTVNGVVQPGSPLSYFKSEPLINLGTVAAYQFSDIYCYAGGPSPGLGEDIALNLANNQLVCSTLPGPLTYAMGGFVFVNNNATADIQGVTFKTLDLVGAGQYADHFVSSIWLGLPVQPAGSDTALIFTYPDGSTWSVVAGVFTFTPISQAAIPLGGSSWSWDPNVPIQLAYSIDAATDGSSQYSVSVYVNGQKDSTTNYGTTYVPGAPNVVGFGPNSVAAGAQFGYTALRFYMEDTTISTNAPGVVVAADWVINSIDLAQQLATNTLPTP